MLLNDPNAAVRCLIAAHGTNEHRDILINDKDDEVRMRVAMYGTIRHVAVYGSDKHRKILSHDKDYSVSSVASRQLEIPAWLLYR